MSAGIFGYLGYDMVRYARHVFVTADRVMACGLRNFELATFAVSPGVTLLSAGLDEVPHPHPA